LKCEVSIPVILTIYNTTGMTRVKISKSLINIKIAKLVSYKIRTVYMYCRGTEQPEVTEISKKFPNF